MGFYGIPWSYTRLDVATDIHSILRFRFRLSWRGSAPTLTFSVAIDRELFSHETTSLRGKMISRLRHRELPFRRCRWRGDEAAWIAPVCRHSGLCSPAPSSAPVSSAGATARFRFIRRLLERRQKALSGPKRQRPKTASGSTRERPLYRPVFQRKTRLDRPLPLPVRVTLPGSLTRSTLRLLNAHGGVFNIFSAPSVTRSLSAILLSPFEFPPSSQRTRGRTGNQEGEVSDPPFFVPRTSRQARPCNTPCNTPLPCGGVAPFSFIPAGRPGGRPASGASLSVSNGKSGGGSGVPAGTDVWGFEGPDREDQSRRLPLIEGGAASSRWRPPESATAAGRSPTGTHAGHSSRAGPAPRSRSDTRPRRSSSP